MIRVAGLGKRYGRVTALADLSFSIAAGETVGFLGPNGAGKTTTQRILAGLLGYDEGQVAIDVAGTPYRNAWPTELRSRIGYLPEHPPCYDKLTVLDHLHLFGSLNGLDGNDLEAAIEGALETFDLKAVAKRFVGGLSKGNRQRAALAWSLLHDPEIVLLDEPFSGLDPEQREKLRAYLDAIRPRKATLLSSHSLADIETLCDRVLVIRDGRIVFSSKAPKKGQGTFVLEVRRCSSELTAALSALPGCSRVDATAAPILRVEGRDTADFREALAEACWKNNAGLIELRRESALREAAELFRPSA